jgi:tetratricopeptide (TPR) repeat protein
MQDQPIHHIRRRSFRGRLSAWALAGVGLVLFIGFGGTVKRRAIQSARAYTQNRRADSYTNRGNAGSAKTEYDKAIADFSEAIRLNPRNAYAYYTAAASGVTTRTTTRP